ncbi:VQ motif-containing protein [Quillaja saponaria]|uniref:VQ motif-containing protein n=1 Tax=Quillaja saponaria TaxID=32244 RepID=A0AAD7KTA0_QUISA|nr:VQ motif-containing protein [Quillaja saponaria]
MEAYPTNSSSSTATYVSQNTQQVKRMKQAYPLHSSLLSVRKPNAKPWKKPVAPLPPNPPKVYNVDPLNFRDLVQKLTGAPEFQSEAQILQNVASLPLNDDKPLLSRRHIEAPIPLCTLPPRSPYSAMYQEFESETLEMKSQKIMDDVISPRFLELNLSPSSYSWFSFPLMSPGTVSSLEQGTVL